MHHNSRVHMHCDACMCVALHTHTCEHMAIILEYFSKMAGVHTCVQCITTRAYLYIAIHAQACIKMHHDKCMECQCKQALPKSLVQHSSKDETYWLCSACFLLDTFCQTRARVIRIPTLCSIGRILVSFAFIITAFLVGLMISPLVVQATIAAGTSADVIQVSALFLCLEDRVFLYHMGCLPSWQ